MTIHAWRRAAAEFIGTLALVLFGCGAICLYAPGGGTLASLGIALAFGGAVGAMIAALGPVSRAHFNPAVTLGFVLAERFPARRAGLYVLAQGLGAWAGAGLVAVLFPQADLSHFGATMPHFGIVSAIGAEAVLTFFLMLTILRVAALPNISSVIAGAAIGGMVALGAFVGGPLCGASMNPARSLGPALLSGGHALHVWWVYALGPCLGAAAAAGVSRFLHTPLD